MYLFFVVPFLESVRKSTCKSHVGKGYTRSSMKYVMIVIDSYNLTKLGARGAVVVKAPRYKPAGRGFDFRWCHWTFSVT
jgi:hypothetical protein